MSEFSIFSNIAANALQGAAIISTLATELNIQSNLGESTSPTGNDFRNKANAIFNIGVPNDAQLWKADLTPGGKAIFSFTALNENDPGYATGIDDLSITIRIKKYQIPVLKQILLGGFDFSFAPYFALAITDYVIIRFHDQTILNVNSIDLAAILGALPLDAFNRIEDHLGIDPHYINPKGSGKTLGSWRGGISDSGDYEFENIDLILPLNLFCKGNPAFNLPIASVQYLSVEIGFKSVENFVAVYKRTPDFITIIPDEPRNRIIASRNTIVPIPFKYEDFFDRFDEISIESVGLKVCYIAGNFDRARNLSILPITYLPAVIDSRTKRSDKSNNYRISKTGVNVYLAAFGMVNGTHPVFQHFNDSVYLGEYKVLDDHDNKNSYGNVSLFPRTRAKIYNSLGYNIADLKELDPNKPFFFAEISNSTLEIIKFRSEINPKILKNNDFIRYANYDQGKYVAIPTLIPTGENRVKVSLDFNLSSEATKNVNRGFVEWTRPTRIRELEIIYEDGGNIPVGAITVGDYTRSTIKYQPYLFLCESPLSLTKGI